MATDTITLIVGLSFVGLLFIGGVIARYFEKRSWNRGYCRDCYTKWECFDCDSSGARGYKCGCGNHSLWVSYRVDI